MNLVAFLDQRLKLAIYTFEEASSLFAAVKQKINDEEEPYIDNRPDDADEPAFLAEYERADLAIDVIGFAALGVVQSAFHSFLHDFVGLRFGDDACSQTPGRSWFARYQSFFKTQGYDWSASGADLDFLEQVNLVRNDDQHGRLVIFSALYASDNHARRYPQSAFSDGGPQVGGKARLRVTREELQRAVEEVMRLCSYIQETWWKRYTRFGS